MSVAVGIAFLVIRLILGLALTAHGTQKLFGWFGGGGIAGTGGFFEGIGFRLGTLFALMAGLGETVGGLLTLLGLGGALGPVLIVLVMLVAIGAVHHNKGFFSSGGGWELPITNIAVALGIAFGGNGLYSLDNVLHASFLTDPLQIWYALAAAAIVAGLNLLARRPAS
ncbi:MAG TPA: DoxX family protein [Candidatus Cybelea sp.]|jgi:putative oxidoreductase|nr:DoxX family protein [Candidatus Cybelea sp.]